MDAATVQLRIADRRRSALRLPTQRELLARRLVLRPGAQRDGYVRGVRTKNWSNTQLYCEQLEKGKRAIESSEELPPLRRAGETAAFGLRMNAGWPFEEFQRTTNFDLRSEWDAGNEPTGRTRLGGNFTGPFSAHAAGLAFCRRGGGNVSALI